jgi:hypothetical protein
MYLYIEFLEKYTENREAGRVEMRKPFVMYSRELHGLPGNEIQNLALNYVVTDTDGRHRLSD